MATKIKEYQDYILKMKKEGFIVGKEYIDITVKELHQELSMSIPTVPTCCCAMKNMMLQGDKYIANPKTTCGYSVNMIIRYYLNDMDDRECLYPLKKRGRKKKDKEALDQWLSKSSYKYQKKRHFYHVYTKGGSWEIYAPELKESNLILSVGKLIHQMDDTTQKISLYCEKRHPLVRKWGTISKNAKEKLNISLLILNDNGEIREKV